MAKASTLNPSALAKKHGGVNNQDKLDTVKAKVRETRDLLVASTKLSDTVKDMNSSINKLVHEELPTLYAAAGIDRLGLEAEGDLPAFDTRMQSFYRASIPKNKETEAFAWLEKNKHGDMIKNVFSIPLGMGDNAKAKKLEAFLKKEGFDYERRKAVPWNTLTAFIKEQVEDRKVKPSDLPLDLLGGYVGSVVNIKPRKKED